jgi:hypothetical protein
MIVCKELDKTFETKEELFKALKDNISILLIKVLALVLSL